MGSLVKEPATRLQQKKHAHPQTQQQGPLQSLWEHQQERQPEPEQQQQQEQQPEPEPEHKVPWAAQRQVRELMQMRAARRALLRRRVGPRRIQPQGPRHQATAQRKADKPRSAILRQVPGEGQHTSDVRPLGT